MDVKQGAIGRRHRRHSAEFKAKVVAECRHPGVSIASVALANGLNANLLRNWLIKEGGSSVATPQSAPAVEEFIALPRPAHAAGAASGEIRIELRRGATTVAISWPASAAAECAAWLQAWLR
ncbi:MAG TPA: transposase [Reyranella sp.]|nr:transposase [Reyranella sp.]